MVELKFYHQIERCNQHSITDYRKWTFKGNQIGWIHKSLCAQLKLWPDIFKVKENQVVLLLTDKTFNEKTKILNYVIKKLIKKRDIKRYHNEPYPVVIEQRDKAICSIDRASAAYFGIKAFGQHVNGYVIKDNKTYMWIARRAKNKINFPGKLDHIVAGGLPFGLSPEENLIKECSEEAGISEITARKAISVGAISYLRESFEGLRADTIYTYDLKLEENFIPKPNDGEVESFKLMPIEEVMDLVANSNKIKLNCNLVLIDFFIRHGFINPEHPEYLKLTGSLRL